MAQSDVTSTEEFRWREFLSWDAEAAQLVAEAHDRPTPPIRSPGAVWSFAVWPKRASIDPQTADTPQAFRSRSRRWIERLNNLIQLFRDPRFDGDFGPNPDAFLLSLDDTLPDDTASEVEELRIRIVAKTFQIVWRGVPGAVQIEAHQEFVRFTFILTAEPHRYRPYLAGTSRERPAPKTDPTQSPMLGKFIDSLGVLAGTDEDAPEKEARIVAVETAQSFLFEDMWETFAADMTRAAKEKDGGALLQETGRLIPGQAFSSLRGLILRTDDAWRGPDVRKKTPITGMELDEAWTLLEERRLSIGCAFAEGRDREFVGGLLLGGQAVFASTLGSTVPDQLANGAAALHRFEEGYLPASRYLLFLRERPDSSQLGRLVERIHSVEAYRLAALRNLKEIRDAADEIRFFGLKLDALDVADETRQKALLEDILKRLRVQAQAVRGGLSYRINRSNLYVAAFRQRMDELRGKQIEGWQPYHVFVERRSAQTYATIASVETLRQSLIGRVQLLLERLQWHELTEVQRDAETTLRSTDGIAYIATIFGSAAVGVEIGPALAEWAPDTSVAVSLPGLGPEAQAAWFGFTIGCVIGAILTAAIFFGRSLVRAKRKRGGAAAQPRDGGGALTALAAVVAIVLGERLGPQFADALPWFFKGFVGLTGLTGSEAQFSAFGAVVGGGVVAATFALRWLFRRS